MHVAVAIVGYRNDEDIVQCLDALARSTYRDFEIVICENGGTAAFEQLTKIVPASLAGGQSVRVIEAAGNLGFAGGTNVCLRESALADAWWILNPDTIPRPDALAAMVRRLERGDCEATGATVQLGDDRVQSYGGHWSPWLARAVSIGKGDPSGTAVDPDWIERTQNYLNGASMLIGRRFISVAGLMREDYFLYCEEVEWCLRALRRGMRLGYAKDAVVVHYQGTTTGTGKKFAQLSRMPVYLGERNRILLTRDLYPFRLPIAALTVLALFFLRAARYRAWRQLWYGFSGWMAGIRNERGLPPWMKQAGY